MYMRYRFIYMSTFLRNVIPESRSEGQGKGSMEGERVNIRMHY